MAGLSEERTGGGGIVIGRSEPLAAMRGRIAASG
jgi:hypothetical protein